MTQLLHQTVEERLQALRASLALVTSHKAREVTPEHQLSAELCSDDPTQQIVKGQEQLCEPPADPLASRNNQEQAEMEAYMEMIRAGSGRLERLCFEVEWGNESHEEGFRLLGLPPGMRCAGTCRSAWTGGSSSSRTCNKCKWVKSRTQHTRIKKRRAPGTEKAEEGVKDWEYLLRSALWWTR
ncbi:hypothetical protein EJB05_21052 [Eragrostis curvula]|uniref:Uncharacterized protein n=1 Tax=Eragrostis curvula TaxID=38414 RepID=A0A5J9V0Q1_9POAL|nr:hypothetical protein EJB05_21052 [Eragrostis curvula]